MLALFPAAWRYWADLAMAPWAGVLVFVRPNAARARDRRQPRLGRYARGRPRVLRQAAAGGARGEDADAPGTATAAGSWTWAMPGTSTT